MHKSFKFWCSSVYLLFLFLPLLLVSQPGNHCQIQCHEVFPPVFYSKSFMLLGLIFKIFHFKLFDILCKIEIQFHSFACGYPVFPITFIERLSFSYWMVLVPLSKIIWPYLWRSFCFIPLFYMPIFMALPPCFDYCSFVISVEIRKHETFNFFLY